MKIIFFGEDSFSNVVVLSLLNAGLDLALVICPFYNNIRHKRLERTCKDNGIEFIRIKNINSLQVVDKVKSYSPDLVIVAHFEKLISLEIINIPTIGCINVHPSLLPEYRGMSPQHYPIINGEKETGVSVHYIDETADTGDIILQKAVQIEPEMYVNELQQKFIEIYKFIVIEAIDLINNSSFKPVKQSHLLGSYYGKLRKKDCNIDVSRTQNEVLNLIRGVSRPYYGATLENYRIWRARKMNSQEKGIFSKVERKKLGLYLSNNNDMYIFLNDGGIKVEQYQKIK